MLWKSKQANEIWKKVEMALYVEDLKNDSREQDEKEIEIAGWNLGLVLDACNPDNIRENL